MNEMPPVPDDVCPEMGNQEQERGDELVVFAAPEETPVPLVEQEIPVRHSASIDDFNIDSPVGDAGSFPGRRFDSVDSVQDRDGNPAAPALQALAVVDPVQEPAEVGGLAAPIPSPKAAPRSVRAAGIVRTNRTPAEILRQLEPDDADRNFRIFINFNDHRFTCQSKVKSPKFVPPYHHATFSKSFARDTDSWRDALKAVHKHVWEKFRLVANELPGASSRIMQTPGIIPETVFAEIQEAVIDKLERPKNYARQEWTKWKWMCAAALVWAMTCNDKENDST